MDESQIMGNLFRKAEQYIVVEPNDIFVEIGTAWEAGGSTLYFAQLAQQHNTKLHTVDINDRSAFLQQIPESTGYCMSGSEWAMNIMPTLNNKIACLYLDNYDYNYWIGDNCQMIQDQKREYKELHNILMNNTDCQVEHLKQMVSLVPYMSDRGIVVCDDTYLYNDCWIGKCGAVVVYLLTQGYQILEIEKVEDKSYGVILRKS